MFLPCCLGAGDGLSIARERQDRANPSDLFNACRAMIGGEEFFSPNCEESLMSTSAWYQGESLKRLLQGAAVGAVATLAIGFGWGGWMLGSSAKTLADSTASSAVVAAIAPICVDQFRRSADAANNLTELKKTDSWQQAAYVEKGGWAIMPGGKEVASGVPQACAAILSNLK
jgi:hypothetical protein